MTPRERVNRALRFEDTDFVPYDVELTIPAREKMAQYYGNADFEHAIGNHLARISHRSRSAWTEVKPGHWRDEWGVVGNRTVDKDIGNVENQVLPERTLSDYEFPDPKSHAAFDQYGDFIAASRDRFRVANIGFSLFERAWTMRGMEHLLVDMLESPEFVHELLDRITEYNLAIIDAVVVQDIDAVMFGDDWGSQGGLIMGPKLWRELIEPQIRRMYGRVREAGKFVMIHSCGDVKQLFPDLVEAGLQVFNPFQPEVMDVFETKKQYYGKLAFYGGISVQRLLPHGTPDEVRDETKRLLRALGEGGGYIASPSHAVPGDVPAENIAAMIDVLKGQV